jgi:hypothetical protein
MRADIVFSGWEYLIRVFQPVFPVIFRSVVQNIPLEKFAKLYVSYFSIFFV